MVYNSIKQFEGGDVMAVDLDVLERKIKGNMLYSITEIANLLGISRSTVKYWVYKKKIPTVKVGNRVHIKGQEILKRYGIKEGLNEGW